MRCARSFGKLRMTTYITLSGNFLTAPQIIENVNIKTAGASPRPTLCFQRNYIFRAHLSSLLLPRRFFTSFRTTKIGMSRRKPYEPLFTNQQIAKAAGGCRVVAAPPPTRCKLITGTQYLTIVITI